MLVEDGVCGSAFLGGALTQSSSTSRIGGENIPARCFVLMEFFQEYSAWKDILHRYSIVKFLQVGFLPINSWRVLLAEKSIFHDREHIPLNPRRRIEMGKSPCVWFLSVFE